MTQKELVRISAILAAEPNYWRFTHALVENFRDAVFADSSALYLFAQQKSRDLSLVDFAGTDDPPGHIFGSTDLLKFTFECRKVAILSDRSTAIKDRLFLAALLLTKTSRSGASIPLFAKDNFLGCLFVNWNQSNCLTAQSLAFLESMGSVAGEILRTQIKKRRKNKHSLVERSQYE